MPMFACIINKPREQRTSQISHMAQQGEPSALKLRHLE